MSSGFQLNVVPGSIYQHPSTGQRRDGTGGITRETHPFAGWAAPDCNLGSCTSRAQHDATRAVVRAVTLGLAVGKAFISSRFGRFFGSLNGPKGSIR